MITTKVSLSSIERTCYCYTEFGFHVSASLDSVILRETELNYEERMEEGMKRDQRHVRCEYRDQECSPVSGDEMKMMT